MNRFLMLWVCTIFSTAVFAQPNHNIIDPEKAYKEAKYHFIKGDYALAYPKLKALIREYPPNTISGHAYINDDINYYYIVCELKLQQPLAEYSARDYVESTTNDPRRQMMSFHLAQYYFHNNNFEQAIVYYEKAGYENLSNEQIADAKFELAYSYFLTGQYADARPLFREITQLPEHKYYLPAQYYYGYIAFRDKNYDEALEAFSEVEHVPEYSAMAPYYIAQIYYFRGEKEKTLQYAEKALAAGGDAASSKDLRLLAGQIYFERKEFAKALPLLEAYVNASKKVSREVMYELSYCYYVANQVEKAIEGFKQLSNGNDSLGQSSMYLLGSLYLKKDQKINARNAFQYSANNSSNLFQQEVSRFNYAKLSFELGFNDVALTSINEFLATYPSSPYVNEAKEILINLLTNGNNYAEALRLYNSYGAPTPTMQRIYPKILFGRATELINEGNLAEAEIALNQITQIPEARAVIPYAWFWKGEIGYRQGNYDEAIRSFTSYLKLGGSQGEANPKNAHYSLAYSYLKSGNYGKAYTHFNQVAPSVTVNSSRVEQDAFVRSADALYMQTKYNTARERYQTVINNSLSQSDYSLYQIALIQGIKNPNARIKTFNTLVQRYPQSDLLAEAYLQTANAYMVQEKFRDAINYLNKILDMDNATGFFPAVYLKLGLSNYNLGKNDEALKNYQQLVKQYPQSTEADEALANLRNIYVEMGKPDEYVEFVRNAGKVVSISEADSLTYAAALDQYLENDCVAAIAGFNKYLSGFPEGAYTLSSLFYRSECYSRAKDWPPAVTGYTAVVGMGNSPFAEKAALSAARIYYFELKNYDSSKIYFNQLLQLTSSPENQLEALRGLTRSYYQTNDFAVANEVAQELLTKEGISTDDKAIANLVLGKSLQVQGKCNEAIDAFKKVASLNKSAWGAEARYAIAQCYFTLDQMPQAEKAALEVIKVAGSDFWVTKAYILLGDIYWNQKDYFNAKATLKSVADNATIEELKQEAQEKWQKVVAEEQANSKIISEP